MTPTEQQILMMISSSGDSKAKAFQALQKVKTGEYEAAHQLLAEAKKVYIEAHNAQTAMISAALSADGEDADSISLLEAHAQDHYMSAQLARDLIEELVDVFEARDRKEHAEEK